jgi:hypothetical protein
MEITIKFSSGKEIKLTQQEYNELKGYPVFTYPISNQPIFTPPYTITCGTY